MEDSPNALRKSYRCKLPNDYVHMLNCICEFEDTTGTKCLDGDYFQQGANKLDTSQWSHVINNAYMKPSVKRPYYYIINLENPTNSSKGRVSDDIKKKQTSNTPGLDLRYGNSV